MKSPSAMHPALTVVDFETRLEQLSGQWRRLAPTVLKFPASMRVAKRVGQTIGGEAVPFTPSKPPHEP